MRTRPTLAVTLLTTLTMIAALAIVSRADADPPEIRTSSIGPVTLPCAKAQQAIGYYRQKYAEHRQRMSLAGPVARVWYGCKAAQRRAVEWRARARDAGVAARVWHSDHWDWQRWLPAKWQRIGACETGYGQIPGNWRHNSGTYQGSFGFHHQSWDGFVDDADPRYGPYPSEAYLATPRQQYEVALAIYRRYGLSGWGCRDGRARQAPRHPQPEIKPPKRTRRIRPGGQVNTAKSLDENIQNARTQGASTWAGETEG